MNEFPLRKRRDVVVGCFRLVASDLPADEWRQLAREVAHDMFQMSGEKTTPSGHYSITAPIRVQPRNDGNE